MCIRDRGIADIVVSDETAEDGSVKKSQTVRVHADGTCLFYTSRCV